MSDLPALSLGISPCPNDTFAFDALLHGRVSSPARWDLVIEDVEALNQRARRGELDVSKVSYAAAFRVTEEYVLLRSGGALGRGCGPLLVTAREGLSLADLPEVRVATPGEWTTAHMLLRLMVPAATKLVTMPFDQVVPALRAREADAGLVIHELRFTYEALGLRLLADLGEWWEREAGHPIPLGGILARRSLAPELLAAVDAALAASVQCALDEPAGPQDFMAAHAQELDSEVMRSHVKLYVNEHTVDLGEAGMAAVEALHHRGVAEGLFEACAAPLVRGQ